MYQQARLFENVVGAIHRHYIDSMGEGDLYQRAATALVTSLNDPYAELLVRENYREYQRQMTGTQVDLASARPDRVGLGLGRATGAEPGDEVLSIDGKSTEGWDAVKVDEALRAAAAADRHRRGAPHRLRPAGGPPDHPDRGPRAGRFAGRPARRRRGLRGAAPDERARRRRASRSRWTA